jgi:hypothetical protein
VFIVLVTQDVLQGYVYSSFHSLLLFSFNKIDLGICLVFVLSSRDFLLNLLLQSFFFYCYWCCFLLLLFFNI